MDSMQLTGNPALPFSDVVPVYNWIYPLSGRPSTRFVGDRAEGAFAEIPRPTSRALYVHIPFCQTICSFCPFVRAAIHDDSAVEAYVVALIREISRKGRIRALTSVPIGAVFFGGGTPSFLSAVQIRRVGTALRDNFDLSALREYSFEFEAKTATDDRIAATRDIGVTHARFGSQTFSAEYRSLFRLTATVDDLRSAATRFRAAFPQVSTDILYGMHGETLEELEADVNEATSLGIDNLDFYPINNLVTQPVLHADLRAAGRRPTTGLTKHYMNGYLRSLLRERGFLPHNGHGYVRVPVPELARDPVVTDRYSFVYHEHTLGYPAFDLLGFGVSALSSFAGFSMVNETSRTKYIAALADGRLNFDVREHSPMVDAARPLALALPYHGSIPHSWLDWSHLSDDLRTRYDDALTAGLLIEDATAVSLTRRGWEWYASLMYYFLPASERSALDAMRRRGDADSRRDIEPSGLANLGRAMLPVLQRV